MLGTVLVAILTSLITSTVAIVITIQKMRRDYKLDYSTERLARELLSHPKWRLRTFKTFQHHMGGLEVDELRKVLLRAGALRFRDASGVEIWGLLSRNTDLLETEYGTKQH